MMMLFNKLGLTLLRFAAALHLQHGFELMRLRQFLSCFEILAAFLELEYLPTPSGPNCFEPHVLIGQRLRFVAVLVEKVQAKAWRNIGFENAQFNAAKVRFDKRPAVRSMGPPFKMVVRFRTVMMRVI